MCEYFFHLLSIFAPAHTFFFIEKHKYSVCFHDNLFATIFYKMYICLDLELCLSKQAAHSPKDVESK